MRLSGPALLLAAIAAPVAASAADMPWSRGPAVISETAPVEEEIGTGWYLRGDIGFSQAQNPSIDIGGTRFDHIRSRGEAVWGGGFGYKFNEWFRADLTVDQISTYGLKSQIGSIGCYGSLNCTVGRSLDGRVIPVLANAYVDFGNWAGFTPYVGAGVGAARLRTSGLLNYTETTSGLTISARTDSTAKWTPAFAGMAGVAIDLGSGIQLDAGYRYLWLSSDAAGTMQQGTVGIVPTKVQLRNGGFHQARIGLRYYVN